MCGFLLESRQNRFILPTRFKPSWKAGDRSLGQPGPGGVFKNVQVRAAAAWERARFRLGEDPVAMADSVKSRAETSA